jgi:hypothetical protein
MLNVGVSEQIRSITITNRLNIELHNIEHNFNDEDRQNVLKRFLNKEDVKSMFLEFQQKTKDIERKLTLFDNIKVAYAQLVAQKSRDNMSYKNAILNVVVST